MSIEPKGSFDQNPIQHSGVDLSFFYKDGRTGVQTEITWQADSLSFKIMDAVKDGSAIRYTYKPGIEASPELVVARVSRKIGEMTIRFNDKDGKGDLKTIVRPHPSNFRSALATFNQDGMVVSGTIHVDEPSLYLFQNIAGNLESSDNEFLGVNLEAKTKELFKQSYNHPQALFAYLYQQPVQAEAEKALRWDVFKKTGKWKTADKDTAFRTLEGMAKKAAADFGSSSRTFNEQLKTAYLLALQAVLHLPDSFPSLPKEIRENRYWYRDIFESTIEHLLQLHKNYQEIDRICASSGFALDYEVDPVRATSVKVEFCQVQDADYGEKSKAGRLMFGEELIWDGKVFRFDRNKEGGLLIVIQPKANGVKVDGGTFNYSPIDRVRIIEGLKSLYDKDWQLVVEEAAPQFTPIPFTRVSDKI